MMLSNYYIFIAIVKSHIDLIIDYMLKAREKVSDAIQLSSNDGWDSVKEKDGIGLWKMKADDSNINIMKRFMTINASLKKVVDFYRDPDGIKSVNKKVIENYTVAEVNKNVRIMRREVKGNLLVSNRDICLFWYLIELTDGSIAISMFSVEHDKVPKTKAVRAELDIGFLLLKPVSDSSTSVLSIIRLDPKGSIPTSLVNKMSKKQHEEFENIKKLLEK